MKLKNKKTGEIGEINYYDNCIQVVDTNSPLCGNSVLGDYRSLAELCEEWEDAPEEPKYCYYLDFLFRIQCISLDGLGDTPKNREHFERLKENGNWFDSREEAKKAVEKLRAWKRLKDNGFGFGRCTRNHTGTYRILLKRGIPYSKYDGIEKDLQLLFGGENANK